MITFQVERWREFEPDGAKLFPSHWENLALDRDRVPLLVDNMKYQQMDDAGILHIVTARREGRLIGYFLAFLMVHPHYSGSGLFAVTDIYWLLPEERTGGLGAKLFSAVEKSLKERGVIKAYLSCKIHQDHSKLFKAMGWKPTDLTFTKYLGDK